MVCGSRIWSCARAALSPSACVVFSRVLLNIVEETTGVGVGGVCRCYVRTFILPVCMPFVPSLHGDVLVIFVLDLSFCAGSADNLLAVASIRIWR